MKNGARFTCIECGYDEWWSLEDMGAGDGGALYAPCNECIYCEEQVCGDCEDKHKAREDGHIEVWEARELSQQEG